MLEFVYLLTCEIVRDGERQRAGHILSVVLGDGRIDGSVRCVRPSHAQSAKPMRSLPVAENSEPFFSR